ncbi:MAG: hypothetical protein IKU86_13300, partial [Thermoguttaceae bacterium]|nr:hypothetical protein [Thermoguttaceae bacterium]
GAALYNRRYDPKGKKLLARPDADVAVVLLARALDLTQALRTRGKAIEDSAQALVAARPKRVDVPGLAKELADCADRADFSKMNEKTQNDGAFFKTNEWRRWLDVSGLAKERKTRDEALAAIADLLKTALPDAELD